MKERYQGIVPLEGDSLAEAAQSFFAQSEQIPSLVRLAADKRDGHWVAGGLLFQHLPEGEEGRERLHTRLDHPDWPHIAVLAGSVKPEELTDPELALDDLLWRLFHEEDEVRTLVGGAAEARLPLRSRLCPIGHRPLPGRGARGDGRRGRPDPRRLRILLVELRDEAQRIFARLNLRVILMSAMRLGKALGITTAGVAVAARAMRRGQAAARACAGGAGPVGSDRRAGREGHPPMPRRRHCARPVRASQRELRAARDPRRAKLDRRSIIAAPAAVSAGQSLA